MTTGDEWTLFFRRTAASSARCWGRTKRCCGLTNQQEQGAATDALRRRAKSVMALNKIQHAPKTMDDKVSAILRILEANQRGPGAESRPAGCEPSEGAGADGVSDGRLAERQAGGAPGPSPEPEPEPERAGATAEEAEAEAEHSQQGLGRGSGSERLRQQKEQARKMVAMDTSSDSDAEAEP